MEKAMEMTESQKERLRALSGHVTRTLQELHNAQIERHEDRVSTLLFVHADATDKFTRALRLQGFMVGDVVRVMVDGPLHDKEALVTETTRNRLVLAIDGNGVTAKASEVQMVTPSS